MKNVKMTICLITAVLVMATSQGFGWTQYKDGGTHNISSTVNDDVWVDYQAPGIHTTVNLFNGGTVSNQLQGYNDSRINIAGGLVGGDVSTYDNTQVVISNGILGSQLIANGNTQITVNGGAVSNYFKCYGNTQTVINNGNLNGGTYSYESSKITVNGGSVYALLAYQNGQITLNEGSIEMNFAVRGDYGQATMNGGKAGYLQVLQFGHMILNGGSSSTLTAMHNSQTDWYGGTLSENIRISDSSILNIYGSDFKIDGLSVGYGDILSILKGDYLNEPQRRLTGALSSGDFINNLFVIGNQSKINLVYQPIPEPATLALLSLGGLMLRRKKK